MTEIKPRIVDGELRFAHAFEVACKLLSAEASTDEDFAIVEALGEYSDALAASEAECGRLNRVSDMWQKALTEQGAELATLRARCEAAETAVTAHEIQTEEADALFEEFKNAMLWIEAECDDAIREGADAKSLMYPFRDQCRALLVESEEN